MAKRAQIENALYHLLQAVNHDRQASDVEWRLAAVPPAAPVQIAALEQHWGRRLPPAYRTLLERGATIVRPPRQEPWGLNEMWIVDPDGLLIGIIEVPPQHPLRRDPRG